MNALGRHILIEFFGCNPEIMNTVSLIEKSMVDAAKDAGATVINSTFHHFSPYGVSGVVVIQESHLAIHTWPEYQYAAVDLFTCGDQVDPWKSFDVLKKAFEANNSSALELGRGNVNMLTRSDFNVKNIRAEAPHPTADGRTNRNVWFTDKDENQALSLRYTGEVLYRKKSPFQRVQILDSYGYGKMLALDNMIMCTEKDEYHYHEMIAHPAMLTHHAVKRVLIIGGGDGGTAREVLRHNSVEEVVMVEIDEAVIEAAETWLPSMSASLKHPKLKLHIADGIQFVADAAAGTFDLVLVDGSDPVGPAEGLFSGSFYQNCYRVLRKNGMLITQGESPKFNTDAFTGLNQCLKNIFGPEQVHTLLFFATTYPSGMWSFQIGSKGTVHPVRDFDPKRSEAFCQKHELGYYNAQTHLAAFALPTFVKKMLNELPVSVEHESL